MPTSVYIDGSGTHGDSAVLTLAACGIADELIDDFSSAGSPDFSWKVAALA